MSKTIKRVFHPSFYLKEFLDELEMSQDEFAKRLGISGKQISLILSQQASITADIAYRLSQMLGTSSEIWLNLQSKYDAYLVQLNALEKFEEEKQIFKMIDKKFLLQLNIIENDDDIETAIGKLRNISLVSSLSLLAKKDIFSFYRTSIIKEETTQNIVCKNLWVSLATSLAKKEETSPFDENKIIDNIDKFRNMTLESPEFFYPKLKEILNECGVSLIIIPSLKNSNINGVVKWLDSNKVMMALNTRGAYNDKFWFSFFHELKHVLQKTKRKMIIGETEDNVSEEKLEIEADEIAKNTLISSEKLKELTNYTEYSIRQFAKKINIHPGIVVGRLQKDGLIKYSYLNDLKEKYEIVVE